MNERFDKKYKKAAFYWRMLMVHFLLLLLPVSFMETVNFISVRNSTIQSLDQLFDSEGKKQITTLEEQLSVLKKVAFNTKLSSCFYSPFVSGSNYPIKVIEIADYLRAQSSWLSFYSQIYYYNAQKKACITPSGVISEELLFERYLQVPDDGTRESFTESGYGFTPVYNQIAGNKQIAIKTPVEEGISCLIFTLDKAKLDTLLSIPGQPEGESYLLYDGKLIYSSNGITDQQFKSETSLASEKRHSVDGRFFTLEWRLPKSVYLFAIWNSIWRQSVVVFAVLSVGFLLIKRAMEFNYKPIRDIVGLLEPMIPYKEKMSCAEDEVQYINRAVGELLYSKQFLEESNQVLKKEQLLCQLLCSHIEKGSILYEECMRSGIRVDRKSFMCLYMEDQKNSNSETGWYDYLTEKLEKGTPGLSVYSIYFTKNGFIFLFSSELSCDKLERLVKNAVSQEKELRISFGKAVESSDTIHDSYLSLLVRGDGQFDKGAAQLSDCAYSYPQTSLVALSEAAEGEQLAKMELAVSNIKEVIGKVPVHTAILIYMEAAEILTGHPQSYDSMAFLASDGDCLRQLEGRLTRLYKRFRAESVMSFAGYEGNGKLKNRAWNRDIGRIVDQIKKHCMESSFSIKSMAAELGTTPSNLSHFFKKCTGQNISKYIESLKMKRAMELLRSNYRVSEAAEMLGYNSTAVFIETFKRICGMTPNQYRQDQMNHQ